MQKIQVQCHRLEKDNQQLMSDLGKANEIIQRKMEENRTFKDKYRRNTELIKKQEKLLQDKDEDIKVNIHGHKFSSVYDTEISINLIFLFFQTLLLFSRSLLVESKKKKTKAALLVIY